MDTNPEIFKGKRFQDLLQDIYENSTRKKTRLETLMDTLLKLVEDDPKASALIVPIFKDLVDVEIRNDEHLVKIAAIVQRLISAEVKESGGGLGAILSEEEKSRLVSEAFSEASKEMKLELDKTVTEDEELQALEDAIIDVTKPSKENSD